MSRVCRVVAGLALALPAALFAQEPVSSTPRPAAAVRHPEEGRPLVRRYQPFEVGGGGQVWSILQDPRGVLYFGTNTALLEFDGARWRRIETGDAGSVRSMALADDGRIYVGSARNLGYLAPAAEGEMRFVSLADRLPADAPPFNDVWRIFVTPEGALFQTERAIFRWANGTFTVIRPASTFFRSSYVGGRVYVGQPESGLHVLEGDTLRLLPGTEALASEPFPVILEYDAGRMLVGTRTSGLFLYDGRTLSRFPTEIDADFFLSGQLYRGFRLPDGSYALTNTSRGLAVIDRQGRRLTRVDRSNGLPSDVVYYVMRDREGALWAALDRGVARIEVPSPLTFFTEDDGLTGSLTHAARLDGQFYVALQNGVRRLRPGGAAGALPQFEPVLIAATDGVIMLLDEESGDLTVLAGFGNELAGMPRFQRGRGIVGAIADTGVAEIVNDVGDDPRRVVAETAIKALVCAPLKVGERVLGVIALGSTRPAAYTAAELKLLNTLGLQAATAIENARLFERTIEAARERERLLALQQQTELARARLQRDLDLAARIQADLFPAALPRLEGYDLAARNRPARSCGGDYYDALPLGASGSADTLLLCVADVAGKGLPAALVMSNMQATLRALLGRSDSLPALATHANELLYGSTSPEKYVTAALVELAPATGALTFVGAGHLDNLILRASGEAVPLASTGAPLGLLPSHVPYGETAQTLEPGDCLVLFSDGVTDAEDAGGQEFGEARLTEVLRQSMHLPAEAMIARTFAAIDAFAGGAPQFDDITMLIVRRLAGSRS